ncbi:MAG: uracil-DNA glycosylase [Ferrovum sp.]|nr:uracil-DNA glycosylase [Ferrovum sp.]
MSAATPFDPTCRRCPRLAGFLDGVARLHPDYFAAPIPSFGDPAAALLVVGLAPGMHGANRTGRPFTGDHAGLLLYQSLFDAGFSNQPDGLDTKDNLTLNNCRITNAVRCLPPANKPLPEEVRCCSDFLLHELTKASAPRVILALGQIAHQAVLRAFQLRLKDYPFGHGAEHVLPSGQHLLDSYHCSRYNTQTRRLTPTMFAAVMEAARALVEENAALVP